MDVTDPSRRADATPAWRKIDSFWGNSSSPALTGHRCCPVCSHFDYRIILSFDDFQFYGDSALLPKRTRIQQVQCQSCHSLYMNPGYSDTGFKILFAQAGRSFGSSVAHQQAQADWLAAKGLLGSGKTLLDVGCYDGHFLSLLPENVKKYGVDMDLPAIERGRSRHVAQDLTLIHGLFESFHSSVQPDVITMFHVLEHLHDPCGVLRNLRNNSHKNTHLVVEVPVLEKGLTNDINGFFSIQHQTHFSRGSLESLMRRAGWEPVHSEEICDYNGYRILARHGDELPEQEIAGDIADRVRLLDYFQGHTKYLFETARRIASWPTTPRCVIWGAGAHTEFLYQVTHFFHRNRNTEYFLVDSDPLKQGTSWRGLVTYDPEALNRVDWSDCTLVISSYSGQKSITEAAIAAGVPTSSTKTLYDFVKAY